MPGPSLDTRDLVEPIDADSLATFRCTLLSARAAQQVAACDHAVTASGLTGQADVDSRLERELAELSAVRAQADVMEIETALARLAAGTYGICESCGRPIASERLEVMPQTRWCVACSACR